LLETVLVPTLLFFHQYVVNPFAYAPISTPDNYNFYKRWYWAWARPVSIPIKRGNKIAEGRILYKIKKALDQNRIVVLFAEGGRTFRGNDEDFLYSTKGNKIRKLKDGIGWLVARTGAVVLPIWVEGTDQVLPNHPTKLFCAVNPRARITIKIGKLMRFKPSLRIGSGKEITQEIQETLLNLADEEE
ncbi:MAG: 1-acyl-sn-glycerol-3-phosphate acyltransferase, partial [Candidatus Portnoybacteria bacterium]|nr:1-acyl-sn-glycerol-3-phosphate acyltransferase [Candidatus Portnoybacteria bacterium]